MAKKKASKKAASKTTTKKAAAKTSAKSAAPKKASSKSAAKPASKKKGKSAGGAFMKPLEMSEELAAVIGGSSAPRTEIVKKLWTYIKKNDLQDPKNKRNILADDKLQSVFGKKVVNMFEMTKLIGKHLK